MSTIIVAAILIASILLISLAFILIHKSAQQKRKVLLLSHFDGELSKRGLSFSRRVVLKTRILAFDPVHLTVLVLETKPAMNFTSIPLDDVNHSVTVKKYENINMGSDKREVIENHLRSIGLELRLKSRVEPFFFPFYESNTDSSFEIAELEAEAKSWEIFLVKAVSERVLRA